MNDFNVLFTEVSIHCSRDVVTCEPTEGLIAATALMKDRNISSLVICTADTPIGILTDRDLRDKVIALGLDAAKLTVGDVMTMPPITISEESFLFMALHLLSQHGIHRLVVTDQSGHLTGIITDSDLLRLQINSPHQLLREIEDASSVADLKDLHHRVQSLVAQLVGGGVRIHDLVRLIAHLNDRILVRLIHLLANKQFPTLSERFTFVVLGSEGRQEQTLATDQDNAIIYTDNSSPEEVELLQQFSHELIADLIAIGVPSCPGGIMASNPPWRQSLSQWKQQIDEWFATPTSENILRISMLLDMRYIHGESSLAENLKQYLNGQLLRSDAFLNQMTGNLLRFEVPLGWFDRIKTEKGDHAGQVDMKKAGIFAITEGIKILSQAEGIHEYSTRERLEGLSVAGKLSRPEVIDLTAASDSLVYFRLRTQIEAVRDRRQPDNRISLNKLNRMEHGQLLTALKVAKSFLGMIQRRFQLG